MDKGKREPPKRWVRRSLAVVGVIVVLGIAWLCIAQRNNLKALYLAMTSDAETLEEKRVEQSQKQEDLLQQYGLTKPDSSQQQETGENGETTTDPLVESTQPEQSAPAGGNPGNTQASDQDTNQLQAELQGYVNQLYQVEARYQQFLDEMVESTKKEFWSLPKDQQVKEKKMEIVDSKANDLIAEEKVCDAEVETILANIEDVLKRQGKSNDLVSSIRSYYEESKASWKAAKMTELYR